MDYDDEYDEYDEYDDLDSSNDSSNPISDKINDKLNENIRKRVGNNRKINKNIKANSPEELGKATKNISSNATKQATTQGGKAVAKQGGKAVAKEVAKQGGKAAVKAGAKAGASAAAGAATAGIGAAAMAAADAAKKLKLMRLKKTKDKYKDKSLDEIEKLEKQRQLKATGRLIMIVILSILGLIFLPILLMMLSKTTYADLYEIVAKREYRYQESVLFMSDIRIKEMIWDNKAPFGKSDDILGMMGDYLPEFMDPEIYASRDNSYRDFLVANPDLDGMLGVSTSDRNLITNSKGEATEFPMLLIDTERMVYDFLKAPKEHFKEIDWYKYKTATNWYDKAWETLVTFFGDVITTTANWFGNLFTGGKWEDVDYVKPYTVQVLKEQTVSTKILTKISPFDADDFVSNNNSIMSTVLHNIDNDANFFTGLGTSFDTFKENINIFDNLQIPDPGKFNLLGDKKSSPVLDRYTNSNLISTKKIYEDITKPYLQNWVVPYSLTLASEDVFFGRDVLDQMKGDIDILLVSLHRITFEMTSKYYYLNTLGFSIEDKEINDLNTYINDESEKITKYEIFSLYKEAHDNSIYFYGVDQNVNNYTINNSGNAASLSISGIYDKYMEVHIKGEEKEEKKIYNEIYYDYNDKTFKTEADDTKSVVKINIKVTASESSDKMIDEGPNEFKVSLANLFENNVDYTAYFLGGKYQLYKTIPIVLKANAFYYQLNRYVDGYENKLPKGLDLSNENESPEGLDLSNSEYAEELNLQFLKIPAPKVYMNYDDNKNPNFYQKAAYTPTNKYYSLYNTRKTPQNEEVGNYHRVVEEIELSEQVKEINNNDVYKPYKVSYIADDEYSNLGRVISLVEWHLDSGPYKYIGKTINKEDVYEYYGSDKNTNAQTGIITFDKTEKKYTVSQNLNGKNKYVIEDNNIFIIKTGKKVYETYPKKSDEEYLQAAKKYNSTNNYTNIETIQKQGYMADGYEVIKEMVAVIPNGSKTAYFDIKEIDKTTEKITITASENSLEVYANVSTGTNKGKKYSYKKDEENKIITIYEKSDLAVKNYSYEDLSFGFNQIEDYYGISSSTVFGSEGTGFKARQDPIPQNILDFFGMGDLAKYIVDVGSIPEGGFTWPVVNQKNNGATKDEVVSSRFGMRIHPVYHVPKMHTGVDITIYKSGSSNPDLIAAQNGKVVFAGGDPAKGYGRYVIIEHKVGNEIKYRTLYAHMKSISVSKNEEVIAGTVIGQMGTTGTSTGTHLHYEVQMLNVNGFWERLDPLLFYNSDLSSVGQANDEGKLDTNVLEREFILIKEEVADINMYIEENKLTNNLDENLVILNKLNEFMNMLISKNQFIVNEYGGTYLDNDEKEAMFNSILEYLEIETKKLDDTIKKYSNQIEKEIEKESLNITTVSKQELIEFIKYYNILLETPSVVIKYKEILLKYINTYVDDSVRDKFTKTDYIVVYGDSDLSEGEYTESQILNMIYTKNSLEQVDKDETNDEYISLKFKLQNLE